MTVEKTRILKSIKLRLNDHYEIKEAAIIQLLAQKVFNAVNKEIDTLLETKHHISFLCGTTAAYYIPEIEMIIEDRPVEKYPRYGNTFPDTFMGLPTESLTYDQVRIAFKESFPLFTSLRENCYEISCKKYATDDDDSKGYSTKYNEFYNHSSGYNGKSRIASAEMPSDAFIKNIIKNKYIIKELGVKINGVIKLMADNDITNIKELCKYSSKCKTMAVCLGINDPTDDEIISYIKEQKLDTLKEDKLEVFIDKLLTADTVRADIEPDDRKCVEDVNLGHWELWNDMEEKDGIDFKFETDLVARNPLADICYGGIVGIDFGTKSTIVSCQSDDDSIRFLRIGVGQLNKKAVISHYENPTVMEFVDINSFIEAYNKEKGRPHTKFSDLYVSHRAANDLKDSDDSKKFYSYFYDLKQWCGSDAKDDQIRLIDQSKNDKVLPAYLDITKNDMDPVELYAYYLGLYINTMRNGIYLEYSMSFPILYSKAAREKIRKSFEKGIKKSLPSAVLNDKEIMKEFKVYLGVSEPAAYAITALEKYGFQPEGDQKDFYGIFDFGGGTTDFDFGYWRSADYDSREEANYDFVITHFRNDGDKYLGGENLLQLMAYEIFKANSNALLKGADGNNEGFTFYKPVFCNTFPGSEVLISNSQEAKRNTKALVEALRPFWEGLSYYESIQEVAENDNTSNIILSSNGNYYILDPNCKIISDGYIGVTLFDKAGNPHMNFRLEIDNVEKGIKVDLIDILENRIDIGVKNFFEALRPLFDDRTIDMHQADKINIFLAGNSSRSPIVKTCFNKYIDQYTDILCREYSERKDFFEVFPALGTDESYDKLKERGIDFATINSLEEPTGKTGVAYGLIRGREGSTIKVISEQKSDAETKFRYYIGTSRRNKFNLKIDRNTPYNVWKQFKYADTQVFEIYYSTMPEVTTNDTPITDINIKKRRCKLDSYDKNADIYIRLVSPNEIEYAVAFNDKIDKNEFICKPQKEKLE